MKKINLKNSSVIIFILIAIFYATGNFIWWKINTPIIPQEISACHFNDVFDKATLSLLNLNAPLLKWITKTMFYIFGKQYFDLKIIFLNYMFFLIALCFVYKIGVELEGKKAGNIAMILFSLTPAIYVNSVHYGHQDWHVMIAIIVNIYCLIKLNCFKDMKWSILYGITVGLGLLVKDEFLAYFFVPWLYVAIKSLVEKIEISKVINITVTILIGSLIAGFHYFRSEIINKLSSELVSETKTVFCFENFKITTIDISEYLLSPPIFLLFIVSLVWFFFRYKKQNKWIIMLWFMVPWLIITFMPHHKEIEYCLGFIPAILFVISVFTVNVKKIFLIVLFVILLFFQYIYFFYDTNNIYSKDFMGIKYFYNISNKLSCMNKDKLDFAMDLIDYIDSNSTTKEIYFDLKNIDRYTIQAISDSCFDNQLKFVDIRYVDVFNFDIIVIDDDSIIERDTLEAAEQAYKDYIESPVSNELIKKEWLKKRIEETEKLKKYKNNFILIKNFLHKDSMIKIYKLEKNDNY